MISNFLKHPVYCFWMTLKSIYVSCRRSYIPIAVPAGGAVAPQISKIWEKLKFFGQ